MNCNTTLLNDSLNNDLKQYNQYTIEDDSQRKIITADVKDHIIEKIRETYENDINNGLTERTRCKNIAHLLETTSQFISVGATILAFSAGFYDNKILSFISGCLGSMSLAFLKTATFALNESKERTNTLNQILKKLNIESLPEITEEI
tara:strand:+ start:27 stop:470 length:444 start_codon:yes stop_codon:yes gene_type:complete